MTLSCSVLPKANMSLHPDSSLVVGKKNQGDELLVQQV